MECPECMSTQNLFYAKISYAQTLLHAPAFYTQTLLHTEAFSHRALAFRTLLRTETFTRGHIHTEVFSTRTLLHTAAFTDKTQKLFHTEASTHSSCYTQKLFCTDAFTYGSFFRHRAAVATEAFIHTRWALLNKEALPQTFLHAEAFAHGSFYTQTFAYRSFCSQNLFHRCFYTFLHTDAFYTAAKSYRNQHRTYRIFFKQRQADAFTHKNCTHRHSYTEPLLHTGAFKQSLWRIFLPDCEIAILCYIESLESDFMRKGHVSRRNHFEPSALRYKKIRNLVLNLPSHLSKNFTI